MSSNDRAGHLGRNLTRAGSLQSSADKRPADKSADLFIYAELGGEQPSEKGPECRRDDYALRFLSGPEFPVCRVGIHPPPTGQRTNNSPHQKSDK